MPTLVSRTLGVALIALVASAVQAQLAAQNYVTGLSTPIAMVQDPTNPNVKFVVQQTGRIRVISSGIVQATDFLNVSGLITVPPTGEDLGERGLLGLTFAPDYATSGHFYINYTDRTLPGNTQIARYTRSAANPLQADSTSAFPILNVAQPFNNHNGGTIRFGPDGFLYIGMGDGGAGNDPGGRAQNPNSLLGKMLRIDPSADDFPADLVRNYRIPLDNPYLDGAPILALPEIWAFGYRNPFKWTFDSAAFGGTNAMIVGDVGQEAWEEIDYEPAGAGGRNYGWRVREGMHNTGLAGTAYLPFTEPIHEYAHGMGTSVTGGYVYRGTLIPGFNGRYFFAEFIQRRVWSMALTIGPGGEATASDVIEHTAQLGGSSFLGNISSIDIDSRGEIYLLSYGGKIMRLLPSGPIEVLPDAIQQIAVITAGGVPELRLSDDQRMVLEKAKVRAGNAPVQLTVEGASARSTASQIAVKVESNGTDTRLTQTVEAFNFTANSWVTLDSQAVSTTDTARTFNITTNASQFIQPGSGTVRMRLLIFDTPAIVTRWKFNVDHVQWTVTP